MSRAPPSERPRLRDAMVAESAGQLTGSEGIMRVSVDQDRCVGAGQCVRWAPEHFEQDEETGIIRPFQGERTIEGGTGVEGAVRACPSGALQLHN